MSLAGGIVTYVLIWWLVLFMVLPWGVRQEVEHESGHEHGAPQRPRLVLKFLVTTGIATALFLIAYAVAESGIITLRE